MTGLGVTKLGARQARGAPDGRARAPSVAERWPSCGCGCRVTPPRPAAARHTHAARRTPYAAHSALRTACAASAALPTMKAEGSRGAPCCGRSAVLRQERRVAAGAPCCGRSAVGLKLGAHTGANRIQPRHATSVRPCGHTHCGRRARWPTPLASRTRLSRPGALTPPAARAAPRDSDGRGAAAPVTCATTMTCAMAGQRSMHAGGRWRRPAEHRGARRR